MNLDFQRQEFRSWNKQLLSLECETARLKTSFNFNESQQQMYSINSVGKSRIVVVAVLVVIVSAELVDKLAGTSKISSSSGSRCLFKALVVIAPDFDLQISIQTASATVTTIERADIKGFPYCS